MTTEKSDSTSTFKPTLEYLLLTKEIEDFFYMEYDLLDHWKYQEWLDLLTDDVRYWMPLARNYKFGEQRREYTKELQELAWFDEGKTILTLRVKQLMTGIHWAEEPFSRISHFVTNVRITKLIPSLADPVEVTTSSRFFVYRNRLQSDVEMMAGKREDTLRKVDGRWKIARRNLYLDQSVLLEHNLSFLL